ncbi:periplasmic heavy metal sensor [Parashewanella curva]|uniref:Periplasmic heavy metal sensor n=1 Tax=Parashewanella curva TaxID=2338552 RepID=A0A3L8PY70_9GAMM|nr:Spy/CpxP family protein refolding chaperone [Parashewanella curva]RLV58992.1 periplasmic heavy metal sensor [Parashewanella curva]
MTISTTKKLMAAAMLTCSALAPIAVYAKPDAGTKCMQQVQKRGHHKLMKFFRKLDLTADQKQQIKDIYKAYRQEQKSLRPTKEDRQAYAEQVKALVQSADFDAQAAANLVDQRSQLRQQQAVATMKLRHDMSQVLTPEQQAKAEQLRAAKKARSDQ